MGKEKRDKEKRDKEKDDINQVPPLMKYILLVAIILVILYFIFFWRYTPRTTFPSYRPK